MPRKNWTPVVLDLLCLLTEEGGARLLFVDDGEETTHLPPPETCAELPAIRQQAAEAITAVDMASMRIMLGGEVAGLSIVLGNGPDEIVQDWAAPAGSRINWMLEAITSKFSRQWEDKPCPVIEDEEPEGISDAVYRAAARRILVDQGVGLVELDPDAAIGRRHAYGVFVAAWVFVSKLTVTAEDRA